MHILKPSTSRPSETDQADRHGPVVARKRKSTPWVLVFAAIMLTVFILIAAFFGRLGSFVRRSLKAGARSIGEQLAGLSGRNNWPWG